MRNLNAFSLTRQSLLAIASLAGVVGLVGSAQAASLVVENIDSFDTDQFVSNSGATIGPGTLGITSSLLGSANRTISGTITAGSTTPSSVNVDVNQSIPGAFSVANGPGRRSNVSTSYAYTGGRDFTVGGVADRILLDILENDTAMTIRFNFTDGDGTTGSLTTTSPGQAGSPALISLLFSAATGVSGGNGLLNFNNITGFNFETNANLVNSSDITLNFVAVGREMPAVPEPSTVVALVSVGLAGLIFCKRKKD